MHKFMRQCKSTMKASKQIVKEQARGDIKLHKAVPQIGMVSFLLSNLGDGWTGMSYINTLSPTSRFVRSTSVFGGMCSAGQRYTRVVLIICKRSPAFASEFHNQFKKRKRLIQQLPN